VTFGGVIHLVETVMLRDAAHMEELRQGWLDQGYEGAIGRLDLPYEQKRSWSVMKLKLFDDGEFEVVEIVEGKGNYTGYAKRVTCRLPDGRTFGAGIKGGQSKFNRDLLGDAGAEQKVVTIRHFGWTKDGIPRMGVATKWHGSERTL
jgi:DNA ligase-1